MTSPLIFRYSFWLIMLGFIAVLYVLVAQDIRILSALNAAGSKIGAILGTVEGRKFALSDFPAWINAIGTIVLGVATYALYRSGTLDAQAREPVLRVTLSLTDDTSVTYEEKWRDADVRRADLSEHVVGLPARYVVLGISNTQEHARGYALEVNVELALEYETRFSTSNLFRNATMSYLAPSESKEVVVFNIGGLAARATIRRVSFKNSGGRARGACYGDFSLACAELSGQP